MTHAKLHFKNTPCAQFKIKQCIYNTLKYWTNLAPQIDCKAKLPMQHLQYLDDYIEQQSTYSYKAVAI